MKTFALALLFATALGLAGCASEASTHGNYNDPNSSSYYPTDIQNPSGTNFNPNSPGYNPASPTDRDTINDHPGGEGMQH